jgi:hypothetical protein
MKRSDNHVYDPPFPAAMLLAQAANISPQKAVSILRDIVKAGWVIAPRHPTNAMLAAYMEALTPPVSHRTAIVNVGKAKKRWAAMGIAGTKVALSFKMIQAPPQ